RKAPEASGSLQVMKREKGGRPPKQSQSPAPTVEPVEEAELIEIAPSELVVSAAGEARQRLQQQVLDFVEKGRVSALDLVRRMSEGELAGVISDLGKAAPSQQDAAPARTQATIPEILEAVATGEIPPDEAALLFGGDRSRPSSQPQPSTPDVTGSVH